MKNDFFHFTIFATGFSLSFLYIILLILINGGIPVPIYILAISGLGAIGTFASGFLVK